MIKVLAFNKATFLIEKILSVLTKTGLPIVPIIAKSTSFSLTCDLSLIFLASLSDMYFILEKSILPFRRFLAVTNGTPSETYLGVPCVPSLTSSTSPNLTHSQLSGISNGFSSYVIGGNGFVFLIFFSLISSCFSALIFSSNTLAGWILLNQFPTHRQIQHLRLQQSLKFCVLLCRCFDFALIVGVMAL
ncbi:Hypothetical cytosolic protein [Lactobacillus helveticus H10]|nr:Hypothetical cytosolic protein [Lactobacillus helveticus H10]